MLCLECKENFSSGKELSNHLKRVHRVDGLTYTIVHMCGGSRPTCQSCGSDTRYTSFQFKKYCQSCSMIAMKEGGHRGGLAPAWNKGRTADDDERIAKQSNRLTGKSNPFWGKQHDDFTRTKISMSKRLGCETIEARIIKRASEFTCLTPIEEYTSRQRQYLQFQCTVCNTIQEKTLQSFERGSLCEICHPNNSSQWQLEVENWLIDIGINVRRTDRTVISPKEIDIYLPDQCVGIECHGLYFHSDAKKDNNAKLHAQKAELAEKSGIKLFQIFQDEWQAKPDIVKEMILHRLGRFKRQIGARKCKVVELDAKKQRLFFEASHLAGYSPAKRAWGLQFESEIVACLSIRIPRQKKWEQRFEISRFAILPGISAPGALSKLTKAALEYAKTEGKVGIMTYVDRRVGVGVSYAKSGFMRYGETGPDYWYTDLTCRYDRFTFRARDGRSEADIAREAKCHKIWGAGSYIFTIDCNKSIEQR